jgi:hypothetical protein
MVKTPRPRPENLLFLVAEGVEGEELPLRVAYAEMELNGVRRLLLVETYRGNVCRLAGRGFVEPYMTVLDGSKKVL